MSQEEKKPDAKAGKAQKAPKKVKEVVNPEEVQQQKAPKEVKGVSFDDILPKIEKGETVTIDDQPGFYFKLESGRLRKFSDNGAYIDSAPLYTFQKFNGWMLKK
jgi:hypothetical protein